MNTNLILIIFILLLLADRFLSVNKEEKTKNKPVDNYTEILNLVKMNIAHSSNVSFEETKTVLNTMIDEYLDHMYTFENDRTHLIKNKDFPTEWGGIYVYPSQDVQRNQIQRLKDSVKLNSSETFLNRIRIFYSDKYIEEYLDKTVEEKYIKRREESDEASREFKKRCLENIEKFQKEAELAQKKEIATKHKRLNNLLSTFSYTGYLPEDLNEIGVEDRIEGVDTHKLLKSRYLCNKKFYDEIAASIHNENDIITGAEKYKRVDDKLVAYLSTQFDWNEIQDNPIVIEEAKHNIVEVMMRYNLNPLDDDLFGPHSSVANVTEYYKGKSYDMDGKRLNNIFYLPETYNKMYTNINEAAVTEEISAIFV